jgi:hypothetical protein
MLKLIAILFVAGFIANTLIVQKAERGLTGAQLKILDDSSRSIAAKLFPFILIGGVVYLLTLNVPAYGEWIFISGLALVLIYLWITHFIGVKRLSNAGLPDKYIRAVLLGGYYYLIPMTLGGIALYLWNIKVIS